MNNKLHFQLKKKAKSPKLVGGLYNIYNPETHIIGPGEKRVISTGVTFWLEPEYIFELLPTIQLNNTNVSLSRFGTVNVYTHKRNHKYKTVDLKVELKNEGNDELEIESGFVIAQLSVIPVVIMDLREFKTKKEKMDFENNFVKPITSFPSGFERWFQKLWKDDHRSVRDNYFDNIEGEDVIAALKEYKKTTFYKNAKDSDKLYLESIYLWKLFKGDIKYKDILDNMEEDYKVEKHDALAQ